MCVGVGVGYYAYVTRFIMFLINIKKRTYCFFSNAGIVIRSYLLRQTHSRLYDDIRRVLEREELVRGTFLATSAAAVYYCSR